ncbi:hypothetical protein [uncultured Alistipes sp.]|uniref:hypothetical protein n=1 Tax=uncultured Alistipes sp. TaxID=538949 RepID=UPI002615FF1D|nr:hypothetical protein [uncultured Alistipes sp.]
MAAIKVIKSIRLDSKGVRAKDANGSIVPLHKRQGDMDGACAVYSLAMAMLCMGVVTNEDLQIYNCADKRTRKGKLLSHFLEEQGLVRNGYSFVTMAKEIRASNFNINAIRKNPKEYADVINEIADFLDEDNPVIISTEFGNGAHALLAIGYETEDNDDKITKILCLDPSEEAPLYTYWNCIIDVSRTGGKLEYPFVYITSTQSYKVALGDILVLLKTE